MRLTIVAMALGLGVLAGCATSEPYPSTSTDAGSAELTLAKGYERTSEVGLGRGQASVQFYYLGQSSDCRDWKKAAVLSWMTGGDKTVRVSPLRSTSVFSETISFNSVAGGPAPPGYYAITTTTAACWGAASFVAEQGHRYRAVYVAPKAGGCAMQILDEATDHQVATTMKLDINHCPAPPSSNAHGYMVSQARQ